MKYIIYTALILFTSTFFIPISIDIMMGVVFIYAFYEMSLKFFLKYVINHSKTGYKMQSRAAQNLEVYVIPWPIKEIIAQILTIVYLLLRKGLI